MNASRREFSMLSSRSLRAAIPARPVRQLDQPVDAPKLASGKVRDLYDLGGELLLFASDRISAFDVVLPGGIPGRGIVLAQLSLFWFEQTRPIVPNHLAPDPEAAFDRLGLRPENRLRSAVVRKLKPLPIECVARGYLAGSAWTAYQENGAVCGVPLPKGLRQASPLPEPVFTPTTKAAQGHDLPLPPQEAAALVGEEVFAQARDLTLQLYRFGSDLARKAGVLLADTKFEFGQDAQGRLYLIDEALTPDSSRYWDAAEWKEGASPPSFDKQIVRDYLEGLDWDKTAPGPELPADIVDHALARYLDVYERLVAVR